MSQEVTRSRGVITGWRDHLIGLVLATAYVALLLGTSTAIGMSRDEGFYVTATHAYARWFEKLAEDPTEALTDDAIDHGWTYNHEHPALIKTLFAWSYLANKHFDIFDKESMAYRFPGMLSAGLLLWLIYIFGARVFGREAGLFAALAYGLMPRPFYHAHLDCFDVPIVLMLTWVTYCYWRSLTRRRWAVMLGIAFGAALATKHNSWVMPGIFLIHFIWMRRGQRRFPQAARLDGAPWWLLAMVIIGPVLFLLSWPWLYHDTMLRIGAYVRFHVGHVYYNMAYFGHNYFQPPFPVAFPFVLTLFTVPLTTLVLCVLALVFRARTYAPRFLSRFVSGATPDREHTDVLLVGVLLAPLVIIALPSSPIFGGTKHWITGYPFLAMYAGYAVTRVVDRLKTFEFGRFIPRFAVSAVLLLPSLVESEHSHPYGLSHYTFAAGGVPGAADYGMNRQFWGFTTGSVVGFLNERLKDGGSVYICDTVGEAWNMLQKDGRLAQNIRVSWDITRADLVLVHHEHHFAEVDIQTWVAHGVTQPVHVLEYDGVPLVTIYENPRSKTQREQRRQRLQRAAEATTTK